jgi:preprotein translocase subunit SecA
MLDSLKHDVISLISRVKVRAPEDVEAVDEQRRQSADVEYQHASPSAEAEAEADHPSANQPLTREGKKVGRNDPCPCGSGKKFKNCHGAIK